jgi:phage-related minor tail protein
MSGKFAEQTVDAYVRVRAIGGAMLGELAKLTSDYATATGRDVPAAAQRLAGAFGDPAKGAKELDHELGILNASQLAAIQNFNALGQTAKAQEVLFGALKDRVQGLTEQALTPMGASSRS